jgi:aryl-alcohol dehydrogenase-like predicted oxidoreductase
VEYVHIEGISIPVSRVVFGTDWLNTHRIVSAVGRQFLTPFVHRKRQQDAFALLDGVVQAGCTAFDTARTYRDSEETIGAWMRARNMRERVAIITKGAHPGPGWASRLTAAEISRDLERSLRALQTDYIDLYLLHYDDGTTEVGPLVEALNRHLAAGRIRAIGLSNWSPARISVASTYAATNGLRPPVVSSVQFSLAAWRHPPWQNALTLSGEESEADRRWYKASGLWLLAYSSLAMGFFSPSRPYAAGDAVGSDRLQRFGDRVFLDPGNLARLKRAREMAERREVSPGQIALAWVFGFDPRVLAIVGARDVGAYVDASKACGVGLSESERAWLSHGGPIS